MQGVHRCYRILDFKLRVIACLISVFFNHNSDFLLCQILFLKSQSKPFSLVGEKKIQFYRNNLTIGEKRFPSLKTLFLQHG